MPSSSLFAPVRMVSGIGWIGQPVPGDSHSPGPSHWKAGRGGPISSRPVTLLPRFPNDISFMCHCSFATWLARLGKEGPRNSKSEAEKCQLSFVECGPIGSRPISSCHWCRTTESRSPRLLEPGSLRRRYPFVSLFSSPHEFVPVQMNYPVVVVTALRGLTVSFQQRCQTFR